MILYHKSNLVYIVVFPQFLIFQQNNRAQTSVLIFFTSRHYYFFEKLKIVEKQLCKLNCSYGKVSYIPLRVCDRVCDLVEKLKIVEKQRCKLNCSYVSHKVLVSITYP